jgi:hypothetical protein
MAQRKELAIVAGGNYSNVTGGSVFKSTARSGFQFGLSFRSPRSPLISFQSELLVIQRRLYAERAPSTLPPLQAGPLADAANLVFAQIPLLLRLQRGYSTERSIRPFFLFGPYVGIRLYCGREVTEVSGTVRPDDCSVTPGTTTPGFDAYIPAVLQNVDFGLLGAFGAEIRRFALSIRGEKSFRNLVEPGALPTSPFDNSRFWTASLSLEYMLRVF